MCSDFYIRHYTNSKYNVIPPNYVKKYLDETYDMNYEFLEEDYYRKNGYHIWEYICQDDEGFIFKMEYCRPTEEEDIFGYKDKTRESLYEIVYSKLEEKFRKHNENRK